MGIHHAVQSSVIWYSYDTEIFTTASWHKKQCSVCALTSHVVRYISVCKVIFEP